MTSFGSAGYVKLVMFLLHRHRCLSDFWLQSKTLFSSISSKLFLVSVMITEGRLKENSHTQVIEGHSRLVIAISLSEEIVLISFIHEWPRKKFYP